MDLHKHYFQGFPNGVSLWEQFGQNDQKLHGNYKINILVEKQWGEGAWGDKSIFLRQSISTPLPQLGETLYVFEW